MEFIAFVFILIGFVVSLIGSVMFLIAAFREGALWGLAVLFLPLAPLIFLVSYWDQAKKGFLIQLGGAGLLLLGAFTLGGATPDSSEVFGSLEEPTSGSELRGVSTQRRSRPESFNIEVDSSDEFLPTESGTGASTLPEIDGPSAPSSRRPPASSSRRPPASSSRRPATVGLSIESVENYIGRKLRFTKTNGKVIEGKLIGVDVDRITIEERVGGGKWSFSLEKSSIARIEPIRRR